MKVLITSGATREPIDSVRFITNFSTGATGAELADHFQSRGHEVSLVAGQGAIRPQRPCEIYPFTSFADLDQILRALLAEKSYDVVIHAAAVSDYSVRAIEITGAQMEPRADLKLDSEAEELTLRLKRNFKLVARIKEYACGREPLLIAFKLTSGLGEDGQSAAVRKLVHGGGRIDWIVHNELEAPAGNRSFSIYRGEARAVRCGSRRELAEKLEELTRRKNDPSA